MTRLQRHVLGVLLVLLLVPIAAFAKENHGHKWHNFRSEHGRRHADSQATNAPIPRPTPSPAPSVPSPTPSVPVPPITGGIVLGNVYVTLYSNIDNTPRGSMQTDLGGHTGSLSGDCTYNNPTSLAVGGSIINGKEVDDFPYGTMFYISDINHGGGCYLKAVDFCGDGDSPQNKACHKPEQGSVQIDAYAGLNGSESCEEANTKIHTVIQNPPAGFQVTQGSICP